MWPDMKYVPRSKFLSDVKKQSYVFRAKWLENIEIINKYMLLEQPGMPGCFYVQIFCFRKFSSF